MAGNVDNLIPEIWSKKAQALLEKASVMLKLVNREHEGEVKQGGDTVHVPTIGAVTINNYTREGAVTDQSATSALSDLVIDQEKSFSILFDKVDKTQAAFDYESEYNKQAMYDMKLVIDKHLHSQYANVAAANVVGTSSAPITLTKDNVYEYFVDEITLLRNSGVTGDIFSVINPKTHGLLLKAPEFIRATAQGDKVVTEGHVGSIAGADINVTLNANTVSGNTPLLFGTKKLISYASQIEDVKVQDPDKKFGKRLMGLFVYGSKVFSESINTTKFSTDTQGAVLWAAGT